ncbi:DEAD/DEAH box helicase, partial [Dehalococcoides mccartyi]
MEIDFNRLNNETANNQIIHPREIFTILTKDKRYQYLRDVQSEVLDSWFAQRINKDTILKMNTGSGKTIVGLLIALSCLKEGFGPAVYVSPDDHLVNQVLQEATYLGIETTEDPNSISFRRGQAILVINTHKLFNGKSVFGLSDSSSPINISTLIIDDVHACIESIEQQFTLTIDSKSNGYKELFNLFEIGLQKQYPTSFPDLVEGDPNKNLQVPYWLWQKHTTDIIKILNKIKNDSSTQFKWPLIKDNIRLADCIFGGNQAEISLRCIPIDTIPSFINANRRVFMSATLLDDSILVSHLDVKNESISNLITPKTANDIGDRIILIPQEINPCISDEELKTFFKKLSISYNVVVIVPSQHRANYWQDVADKTLSSANIYNGIISLKNRHIGLVVLINRYDGIDLADDACRILVIDGLPDIRRRIDKIEQTILAGSDKVNTKLIQRIEQGMGRGIRSRADQCAVFLIGHKLTDQLYSKGAINKFSPATQAQLNLSDRIAEQLRGSSLDKLEDLINLSIEHDPRWVKASKEAIVHLKYEQACKMDPIILQQRYAFNAATMGNYGKAIQAIQRAIDNADEPKIKGWLLQQLATYTNFLDPVRSQRIQKSAIESNPHVIHPIEGVNYTRLGTVPISQSKSCREYALRFENCDKYLLGMHAIIEDLVFLPETSEKFEEALNNVALSLGFIGQRPDAEYHKGPDNLWQINSEKFLVIECKNGSTDDEIIKRYCDQLSGHMNWFEEEYRSNAIATPIIIHPVNVFSKDCSPHPKTRVLNQGKLSELRCALEAFSKA